MFQKFLVWYNVYLIASLNLSFQNCHPLARYYNNTFIYFKHRPNPLQIDFTKVRRCIKQNNKDYKFLRINSSKWDTFKRLFVIYTIRMLYTYSRCIDVDNGMKKRLFCKELYYIKQRVEYTRLMWWPQYIYWADRSQRLRCTKLFEGWLGGHYNARRPEVVWTISYIIPHTYSTNINSK